MVESIAYHGVPDGPLRTDLPFGAGLPTGGGTTPRISTDSSPRRSGLAALHPTASMPAAIAHPRAPVRQKNFGAARYALVVFRSPSWLGHARQLERSPYMAGDAFTAATFRSLTPWSWLKEEAAFAPRRSEQAYVALHGHDAMAILRAMRIVTTRRAWVAKLACKCLTAPSKRPGPAGCALPPHPVHVERQGAIPTSRRRSSAKSDEQSDPRSLVARWL
jgi:hypothetical protein